MSIDQRSKSRRGSSAVVVALLACWSAGGTPASAQGAPSAELRTMAQGVWGGDHIRMVIGREGAQLEFDCATGTIDRPIVLDGSGRFTAKGSYAPERGGPRRESEAAAPRARYVGRVRADTMTLTVVLDASAERVGVFTLKRGNDPLLAKCR
jgi:hypothetical protein